MTRTWMAWLTALALAFGLWAPAAVAQERDRDRVRDQDRQELTPEQDRDRLRIRDELHKDAGLTEPELAALDPELREYALRRGDPQQVRETVRAAVRAECKGACLGECIRATNMAMARGASAAEAGNMVRAELREQERARTQAGVAGPDAKQLRNRLELRLTKFEQERVRERERARDGSGDRDRARDRVRDPATHGGGAGPRR